MPNEQGKLPTDRAAYDAEPREHTGVEAYSGKNKIPTVGQLMDKQKRLTEQSLPHGKKKKQKENDQPASEAERQKKEEMDKANAPDKPNARTFHSQGEREVLDPVTGQMVVVKDANYEDWDKQGFFSRDKLDPAKPDKPGPSTNIPGESSKTSEKDTNPIPVEPSNILLQPFPEPVKEDTLKPILATLQTYSLAACGFLAVVWFFVAFGSGYKAFLFRSSLIGGLGVCIFLAQGIVARKLEKELDRIRMNLHKQRGKTYSPPTPESTEWLNSFVSTVWPLIDPATFTSLVDMIEDVMQASLPGFIDAVKVDDFTIGKNSIRILAMRGLPDKPTDKDYPKEEWIDQGSEEHALDPARKKELKEAGKVADKAEESGKKEGETEQDLDQTGDYVNFEVSFAYMAPPGTKKLQGENISLIIQFFIGFHDWFHIPIPLWIAVESIVGTVRLRCQMVAQAPYIRNLTFTLMGVPAIEASAIPLSRALPNVLDLPMVSGFVKSSIAAACDMYCAPKSMTMNLAQMLSGDGVKRDTNAIGVLAITIHYAENLSAQDDNGFSDPYVVLAFAKFGKPLFSTRIVPEELNPVWEQTAFLLVGTDEVRAGEDLSVQLWDSDKVSADDLVGRVKVPLWELMKEPNKVHKRTDKLMGFEDADEMDGKITWSVAYYEKAKLNPSLKKDAGVDHTLPKELQDKPELKQEVPQQAAAAESVDVQRTPPDPRYPSGIFSIVIHQINNLQRQELGGAKGKDREGHAGQDTDDPSEQDSNVPNAYCEILLNDDLVFKTRVKRMTTMPFFEAGHETFIRDYRDTIVRVVVRDARLREADPVLGIVNLPLHKIFAHSSEVTRLYSIQDGIGFGKINISVLFKGVQVDLPKNMLGWDTGTICVTKPIRVKPEQGSDFDWKEKKLVLSTLEAKQKLPSATAKTNDDGSIEWDVSKEIRLPTYDRYSSALCFEYGGGLKIGPLGNKTDALGVLWMQELVDDEEKEIRIPIVVGDRLNTLKQNVISDQCKKTHEYEIVGWLETTVKLDAGLDEDHAKYATSQTQRHEFEAWDRTEGMAKQAEVNSHANDDGVVDKEEQKAIEKAHKRALESRHRGKMQFNSVRTLMWMKQGLKDRIQGNKTGVDKGVASEA